MFWTVGAGPRPWPGQPRSGAPTVRSMLLQKQPVLFIPAGEAGNKTLNMDRLGGPSACLPANEPGDHDAEYAQRQVEQVVPDVVAVGQQPEQRRNDEA